MAGCGGRRSNLGWIRVGHGGIAMRSIWLASGFLAMLLIGSCQAGKKGNFTVSGTFENADKLPATAGPLSKVFLLEVSFTNPAPTLLDSARIPAGSGKFTLSAKTRHEGIYEVVFGNQVDVPLINDTGLVAVHVDLGKKDDYYDVRGSEASKELKEMFLIYGRKNFAALQQSGVVDSLQRIHAPDSVQQAAIRVGNLAVEDLNTYLRQVINSSLNPTVAAVALTLATHTFTKGDFEMALNDLVKKYPNNYAVRQLKEGADQEAAELAQQKSQIVDWSGKQVPDLSLPDANGHSVSLASFRGKYVLVDFWASWCEPCRMENPNVVKVHTEFKDKKNFAILGVSLDQNKEAWQQAIQEDGLDWTQVSDLKNWNSKAVSTFQFNSIPYNVLVDPQGKVIASALRGRDLEDKLKEVLH